MPGFNGTGAAKRSYPMPEVRGGGREKLPLSPEIQGWQPKVPGCDGAGARERMYPTLEFRGGG